MGTLDRKEKRKLGEKKSDRSEFRAAGSVLPLYGHWRWGQTRGNKSKTTKAVLPLVPYHSPGNSTEVDQTHTY